MIGLGSVLAESESVIDERDVEPPGAALPANGYSVAERSREKVRWCAPVVHTGPSSPAGGDAHPPGQTTQLTATGVAPGLAQQVRDRFPNEQVVVDPLRGDLLGAH
jgi:hypothetical protein